MVASWGEVQRQAKLGTVAVSVPFCRDSRVQQAARDGLGQPDRAGCLRHASFSSVKSGGVPPVNEETEPDRET